MSGTTIAGGFISTLIDRHEAAAAPGRRRVAPLKVVGLFAGIGGIELGLHRSGHTTLEMCEVDALAQEILRERFSGIPVVTDVSDYESLPDGTELIVAGFPCQDLSQAGRTLGIGGARSGLIGEVFRILRRHDVRWVLLENVSFMLHLRGGAALDLILSNLEELGYRWAYRTVDSRSFGLPQRRERVFFLASRSDDPRDVLLADDTASIGEVPSEGRACGFYWTEGNRGLGWAVNAVPTLKGGSTLGIPSPPAIWLPGGPIITPSIRDAERLQGFDRDWTAPAENIGKRGMRWKLVGNAVSVPVAEWIGRRLREPSEYVTGLDEPIRPGDPWPRAAYNVGASRKRSDASAWPIAREWSALADFVSITEASPLSFKATDGFLRRFEASKLRKPRGFVEALKAHRTRMAIENTSVAERQRGEEST